MRAIFFRGDPRYCQAMHRPGESSSDHLRAHQGMQRFPSPKLELFVQRGFLLPEACAALIAQIDALRRPSTIADSNGDNAFRTSETCDLDIAADPLVDRAQCANLHAISGIDPAFMASRCQGQRYAVGPGVQAAYRLFRTRTELISRNIARISGQRSWTFMVYLNAVAAGGGTRFPELGRQAFPA